MEIPTREFTKSLISEKRILYVVILGYLFLTRIVDRNDNTTNCIQGPLNSFPSS